MKRLLSLLVAGGLGAALVLAPRVARATSAFVTVEQDLGGVTYVLLRVGGELGAAFSSGEVPSVTGWRFVGWTVSTAPDTVVRDVWGRAFDVVSVKLYEETTFTAHYVSVGCDTDGDGVADGDELYWYGLLNQNAASDTDGDGLSFAAELEGGTNPHFPDADERDRFGIGIVYDGRDDIVYNPRGYPICTFRSDPEGVLFATYSEVAAPGTTLSSPVGMIDRGFAFWQIAGVAQRDVFGRARDTLALTQVPSDLVIVAIVETNALKRASLYWYGRDDMAADSDTDGDGLTFAEELELGTNPLFADDGGDTDGVVSDGRDGVVYNPHGWRPYVVKADDDKLFAEYTDYVVPGTRVTTPTLDAAASDFAGWSVDGVVQRDSFGRARDAVSFEVSATGTVVVAHAEPSAAARAALYWYGRTDVSLSSDTDGDGKTLAEEIAEGTNPLFADNDIDGGVEFDGRDNVELNVQFYERVDGFVIGGVNRRIVLGTQIWPVVADVNGDGLWDLVVVSETATNVFVNVGVKGNPQFEERGGFIEAALPWCDMNSTAKLAGMTLDVEPVGALSATTNGATLLVSDGEGRIWYYTSTAVDGNREQSTAIEYTLAHKVWGGSYAGFAKGLRLAAVDWEDDGDLDCICGTAEGKLMLLRDPKVGRPTGLVAEAGVDSVKLEWEPNGQSRVRGYKVYRAVGGSIDYGVRGAPALPTYHDMGLAAGVYGYKVSAMSRFYTAGNSTPTETESIASEPVLAKVGGVALTWGEPVVRRNGVVEVVLSINNSLDYDATGLVVSNVYDTAKMKFLKVVASGLSEGLAWELGGDGGSQGTASPTEGDGGSQGPASPTGVVTLEVTGGEVAAGSGTFFTFVFEDLTSEKKVLLGDVNGDGVVDINDLRLLAKLKSAAGRKYTDYQLKAGDFNGNGNLDNADYQALRAVLRERGLL